MTDYYLDSLYYVLDNDKCMYIDAFRFEIFVRTTKVLRPKLIKKKLILQMFRPT